MLITKEPETMAPGPELPVTVAMTSLLVEFLAPEH